jgi:hypothetical protein
VRFAASLEVDLPADIIERSPTLWDTCRSLVGAKVRLATDRVRTRMEAATFLHQVRTALDTLGIDNARFLVVDGVMVFEDARGQHHDLPDLMVAFIDHVLVASEAGRLLRLCVEHEEVGLSLDIEARFAMEHESQEPAALVSVLGRVLDFAPRPEESVEAYRRRISAIVADPKPLAALQLQFTTFVSRLEQALAVVLPGASTRAVLRSLGIDGDSMGRGSPSPREDAGSSTLPSTRPAATEGMSTPRAPENTFTPSRNFTLSVEQRIGAAIAGPPPFAVRLRKMEDLRESLVKELALAERESLDAVPTHVIRGLETLNRLIEEHNFAYPIERNLPIDTATGGFLLGGETWSPMQRISIDDLRRETAAIRRAPAEN